MKIDQMEYKIYTFSVTGREMNLLLLAEKRHIYCPKVHFFSHWVVK